MNTKPKFRIVYEVISNIGARTRKEADEEMDRQSDDLDEYCAQAVDCSVTAVLQERVKFNHSDEPVTWVWRDVI